MKPIFAKFYLRLQIKKITLVCNNSASKRNASLLASFTVSVAYFRKVLLAPASKTLQISIFFFNSQVCFAQINSKCAIFEL